MSNFKVIANNTVSIWDGEDNLYHIIPSGLDNKYLVVDGGPHFNGEVEYLTKEELKEKFNLDVSEN